LPTANSSNAEIDIHESNLEKIKIGLPAVITVDALPGKKFFGTVTQIAPLPDAQSMWMNPDLKVYNTEIQLEGSESSLRTGMSCQAEIIIQQHQDVLYVPVQAVMRVAGEPTVYVKDGATSMPRKVKIGLDNNRMIHIIDGLKEGEVVLLTPSLKAAEADVQSGVLTLQNHNSADNADAVASKVDERLKQVNGSSKDKEFPDQVSSEQKTDGRQADRRPRFENMTAEEREQMRKRFESMSPEEREKMKQRRRKDRPEGMGGKMD
jgi:HlyD family secretion protein